MSADQQKQVSDLAWEIAQAVNRTNIDLAMAALGVVAGAVIAKSPPELRQRLREELLMRISGGRL